jgi:uncharacterized tellurite resistance protein B-like protein
LPTLDLSVAQAYAIPAWLELSSGVPLANYVMRTDGQVHNWQHHRERTALPDQYQQEPWTSALAAAQAAFDQELTTFLREAKVEIDHLRSRILRGEV